MSIVWKNLTKKPFVIRKFSINGEGLESIMATILFDVDDKKLGSVLGMNSFFDYEWHLLLQYKVAHASSQMCEFLYVLLQPL